MKILVLGSTGFIGKNLINRLREDSYEVYTAQRSTGIDIREYDQICNKIKEVNPDVIYNLASHGGSVHYVRTKAGEVFHDNVQMALNLYRAVSEINPNIKIIQPFSNCSYPGKSGWMATYILLYSLSEILRGLYFIYHLVSRNNMELGLLMFCFQTLMVRAIP